MNDNRDKQVRVDLAVAIIAIVVTVIIVLVYFGWKIITDQSVSIPYHMTPHLAILGLLKDSYKMKAVDRRILRKRRRVATERLFRGIIWFIMIVVFVTLVWSQLP